MPILIFSSKVQASKNIAEQLIPLGFEQVNEREWQRKNAKLIDCQSDSILDVPTDFQTDYILILSSHKMKKPIPMFTVHFPGNWNDAKFGGEPKTLNIAYASKMKQLLLEIERASMESIKWPIDIETDHHGPNCNVPIIYVELGSSEEEWGNKDAAKAIAKGINKAIDSDEKYSAFFGVGGGHYATAFFRYIKESNFAVGHILPKHYLDTLDENIFEQAIKKNVEKINEVIVLKDETSASDRDRIRKLCEKFSVSYKELAKNGKLV